MPVVVKFAEFQKRDTVAVLRELLVRASKGEVAAFAFNAEMCDGTEKMGFTGKYRADPAAALKTAGRMSQRLSQIREFQDAARPAGTHTSAGQVGGREARIFAARSFRPVVAYAEPENAHWRWVRIHPKAPYPTAVETQEGFTTLSGHVACLSRCYPLKP